MSLFFNLPFILLLQLFLYFEHITLAKETTEFVTGHSVVKLLNKAFNVRLHSHRINYATGSGQQSVTAVTESDDHNSYWQIFPAFNESIKRGTLFKCNSKIRLMHLDTKKFLHSHHFSSPLSDNLEISAFGEDGLGDQLDDWVIKCSDTYWRRDAKVRLMHAEMGVYLHISGKTYGSPIRGQMEVVGYEIRSDKNLWTVAEGLYVMPREDEVKTSHDEL
ncbi:hypothetical protein GJ496_005417 [Pomphorhynchus laevis]|nr:hypothetical protein GJ496_005417 [Pomphorhynchus laevis]